MAARRVPGVPLVLLAAAGRPVGVVLREQLVSVPMPTVLPKAALTILARLEAGPVVAAVPLPLAPLFWPSVQLHLRAWLALTPAPELAAVDAPVFVVQEERDLQITRGDAEGLVAVSRDGRRTLACMVVLRCHWRQT